MATLTIGDKSVTVDDAFLKLSPEEQSATVEEIAASLSVSPPGPSAEQTSTGFATRENREQDMSQTPGLERAVQAGKAQAGYDVLPWYGKAAQAADDIVRLGVDGVTAGYADQAAGYLGGEGAEAERAKTQAARDRAGYAGTAAEIGGSVYGAGKLLKGGAAVAQAVPGVRAAATGAANLAARPGVVGYGAKAVGATAGGAGLGALNAAGHDEDIGTGAAVGAAAGLGGKVAGDVIGGTVGKVAGWFNKKPTLMTREQLKEASTAAYRASDDAGVIIKPQALQRLALGVQGDLAKKGYHPDISPEIKAVLSELDRVGQGNVTLQGVDILRQIAGGAAGAQNAKTKMLGARVMEKIDDFLDKMSTGDVLMGNKTQGVMALQQARKLWASQKKSEMVEAAIERAKNQAAAAGSGGNIDNALRQQFKTILNNPKLSRGLTKDEKVAMQLIVRGTKGQNLARLVGKLSPQGNGLMLLLHGTGGIASGGATLPLAAVGSVGKVIADRATPSNVEQLSQIIRAGGDASATRTAPNAVQRLAKTQRDPVAGLIRSGGILGFSP